MQLHILSGGAAQGLVSALAPQFERETGYGIAGTFGAVGAMRDKLLAGEPADLLILTRALIEELTALSHVVAGSAADIGTVHTAVAVRDGDPVPAVGDAANLRAALLGADAIYFPDPKLATAGIHFAKVLDRLGIASEAAGRLKTFPNGATAMAALAAGDVSSPYRLHAGDGDPQHAGCPTCRTAAARIRTGHDLYRRRRRQRRTPDIAQRLARLLSGDAAASARKQAGFA